MTFNFAPWAIDGARTSSALARLSSYASGGGRSGVIRPTDLRVTALAVPGQGLRISSGGATILNGYLSDPDEAYVVSNPAEHVVLAASMPPSTPGTSYYLVCIVVGDPEFDQTGHPFMPGTALDPVDALDFEYVRIVVLPCGASDDSFEDLGVAYAGYALARLEVPGSTTTITNAMITDLRDLSKPRQYTELLTGRPSATEQRLDTTTSPGGAWYEWVDFRPYVDIPKWATRMRILTHMNSIGSMGENPLAEVRTVVEASAGPAQTFDVDGASSRSSLMTSFDQDVALIAGTTVELRIQGRQLFDQPGYAFVDERTQVTFDVRFDEGIV